MEADPSTRTIHLNPKFCVYSEDKNRNRCVLYLTVKLLHEVCNLLTTTFSVLAGVLPITPVVGTFVDTPLKIGPTYCGKKLIGDCGFGMEELVFGGRILTALLTKDHCPYEKSLRIFIRDSVDVMDGKTYSLKDEYVERLITVMFSSNLSNSAAAEASSESLMFDRLTDSSSKTYAALGVKRTKTSRESGALCEDDEEFYDDCDGTSIPAALIISVEGAFRGRKT
jgi:hypothetical protein